MGRAARQRRFERLRRLQAAYLDIEAHAALIGTKRCRFQAIGAKSGNAIAQSAFSMQSFESKGVEVSEKQATADRGEAEELRGKLEQAHAVIAHLLTRHCPDLGAEGQRALDYFAGDRFRPDFLPWPNLPSDDIRPEDLSAANDG